MNNEDQDVNFNCTIQELKHQTYFSHPFPAAQFQLHHTGIKTVEIARMVGHAQHFNCTIQELKPLIYDGDEAGVKISIAPYRN